MALVSLPAPTGRTQSTIDVRGPARELAAAVDAEVLLAAARGTALGDYPEWTITHRPGEQKAGAA